MQALLPAIECPKTIAVCWSARITEIVSVKFVKNFTFHLAIPDRIR